LCQTDRGKANQSSIHREFMAVLVLVGAIAVGSPEGEYLESLPSFVRNLSDWPLEELATV
jgi:hypothetical protein